MDFSYSREYQFARFMSNERAKIKDIRKKAEEKNGKIVIDSFEKLL
jgi:hypothetical protein